MSHIMDLMVTWEVDSRDSGGKLGKLFSNLITSTLKEAGGVHAKEQVEGPSSDKGAKLSKGCSCVRQDS